jgi:hypothetical protein
MLQSHIPRSRECSIASLAGVIREGSRQDKIVEAIYMGAAGIH